METMIVLVIVLILKNSLYSRRSWILHELEENKSKITKFEHSLLGTVGFKSERKVISIKLKSSKFRAAVSTL